MYVYIKLIVHELNVPYYTHYLKLCMNSGSNLRLRLIFLQRKYEASYNFHVINY